MSVDDVELARNATCEKRVGVGVRVEFEFELEVVMWEGRWEGRCGERWEGRCGGRFA